MTAIVAFKNKLFVDRIATYGSNNRIVHVNSKVQKVGDHYYVGCGYGSEIDMIITCLNKQRPFNSDIEHNSEVFTMSNNGACKIEVQKDQKPTTGLPLMMPVISGDYWGFFESIIQLKQLDYIPTTVASKALLDWWLNDARRCVDINNESLVDEITLERDGTITIKTCSLLRMTEFAFDAFEDGMLRTKRAEATSPAESLIDPDSDNADVDVGGFPSVVAGSPVALITNMSQLDMHEMVAAGWALGSYRAHRDNKPK